MAGVFYLLNLLATDTQTINPLLGVSRVIGSVSEISKSESV